MKTLLSYVVIAVMIISYSSTIHSQKKLNEQNKISKDLSANHSDSKNIASAYRK
ncbi:MAG: hypothetical protein ACXWCZ_01450 [Flavisolibacter sp.]